MLSWLKPKLTIPLLVLVAASLLFFMIKYMHRSGEVSRALYEPDITMVRIGGVPLIKGLETPVDVMKGLPVEISCDYVPPVQGKGTALFRLSGVLDTPIEATSCKIPFTLNSEVGTLQDIRFEYLIVAPDGRILPGDFRELQVRVIPEREFFRIRALETADGQTLPGLTVPHEVIPYAEAALRFNADPKDFSVLFFVSSLGQDRYSLQFRTVPDKKAEFELISAPLKQHRSWGGDIDGLAAWPGGHEPGSPLPTLPIKIGHKDTSREAFEIVAAIVRTSAIDAVQQETISYDVQGEEQVIFRPIPVKLELIKELAYKGLVSESLRVVRTRATTPIPNVQPASDVTPE